MNYKIYKLTNDQGLNYIGSTKLNLEKRLTRHKSHFLRFLNNPNLYNTAHEVFKGTGVKIELLEDLGDITKTKVMFKENDYIKNINCVNKNMAILTEEDRAKYREKYRDENIDEYLNYQKQYYKNNKKYFEEYHKKPEQKERQKNYYQRNKERIIERQKQYYRIKIKYPQDKKEFKEL